MKTNEKQKLIVILGPTASGKTDLGIHLAKKYDGEIVSADSRLVYKEMDIGTAKPQKDNPESKQYIVQGIPHHLIDINFLKRVSNVATFKKKAIKQIKEVGKNDKQAFLVGGTGLYIDSITNNLDFPGIIADEKLREKLERQDLQGLFNQYQTIDPIGAENIDKNNRRRLIRAIEVCKLSGKSFWENRRLNEPIFDTLKIGIDIEKSILLERISKRTTKMIRLGLKDEAFSLIKKYGNISPLETIGYQEWKDYLKKEKLTKQDLENIKERIIINTNKFAKRQMTWFKRDPAIHWIKNKTEAQRLINKFLK
jgi:tRNA dimethylallyltransferase